MDGCIALDATYSIGDNLTGVGVYSREILFGIARQHPEERFVFCYRPHRFLRSFSVPLPPNAARRVLHEPLVPRSARLFHGLNQRLPQHRFRRTVTTFHDLFVLTGDYSSPEFRKRFEAQARDAAARSDLIVAVSAFTAAQIRELLGVEPSRLRVVHHGIAGGVARGDAAHREKIVLHVGAIQKRKNIARLVRAFSRLDEEWRLVLAGSLGFGADEILREIGSSAANSRIEVTGYVPAATLAGLYRRASIFAFPSLDEGFGMPVLEAMAAGLPVITSNRSALPEVAGDAALLVDPFNEEEIGEALLRVASDETLRRELIEKGIRRANEFTWERAVQKTWTVYREIL